MNDPSQTTSPALELQILAQETWDAVVIGAGPAGALAARQLARAGLQTLLIDRKVFPRDKVCGGCVNPRALALLAAAGLGGLCASLGARPVHVWQLHCGRRRLDVALPGGAAVSRSTLDAALVEEAQRAGAIFLQETTASLAAADEPHLREILLQQRGQDMATLRTRSVLVCDGLGHASLHRLPEFTSHAATGSRIGVGALLPAAAAPPEFIAGRIYMAAGRGGYVGLVRVEDDRLNIAAALSSDILHQAGSPASAAAVLLASCGLPEIEALPIANLHGTPALTRRTPRVAARRLFVLGDAAGYVEPVTGEGITWALAAALAVVPLVQRACVAWDDRCIAEWTQTMQRAVRRRQWLCRSLVWISRRSWAVQGLMRLAAACPWLVTPIVGHWNAEPQKRAVADR